MGSAGIAENGASRVQGGVFCGAGAVGNLFGALERQDKQLERRFREHAEAEPAKNAPSQEVGGVFAGYEGGKLIGALERHAGCLSDKSKTGAPIG